MGTVNTSAGLAVAWLPATDLETEGCSDLRTFGPSLLAFEPDAFL
jgi:hypothetical protein